MIICTTGYNNSELVPAAQYGPISDETCDSTIAYVCFIWLALEKNDALIQAIAAENLHSLAYAREGGLNQVPAARNQELGCLVVNRLAC